MSEIHWERELQTFESETSDAGKPKRRAALKKIDQVVTQDCQSGIDVRANEDKFNRITRTCCKGLEDKSEGVRELSIKILNMLITVLDSAVLQYVLPSVTCRIGLEDIAEESEVLRLQLLELALRCITTFPTDVGPLGYLDYYTVLLTNCLKDPYPDLKRAACRGAVTLCEIEPKNMKQISPVLAKVVKLMCLQHKHSTVRADAVKAFGILCQHGAVDILGDMKDEQDHRTSIAFLYVLCSDQSETVRLGTVATLSLLLLDMQERAEQHRRLIPHVLLLLTDPSEPVRLAANSLMLAMGKLHMDDNEDHTADLNKRRINMKDMEGYVEGQDDEVRPDMSLWVNPCPFDAPGDWLRRPMIGARYVVSECTRNFLDSVLKDVTVLDWMIPYSSVNKRVAALRILCVTLFYIENDSVQYAPQVLQTLYKVLQDENKEIVTHSHFAVEMLGKFLTPEQFLPFLVPVAKPVPGAATTGGDGERDLIEAAADATPTQEETGDLMIATKGRTTMTKQSMSTLSNSAIVMPTLFSSAAIVTKTSVLIAFRYFLRGAVETLQNKETVIIVKALCQMDVTEIDSPALLKALVEVIVTAVEVLAKRHLVCTPGNPMPDHIKDDTTKHMHDSKLLYALLCLRSAEDRSVVATVDQAIKKISVMVTGTDDGIFDLHFGRLLVKHQTKMPVDAFEALVSNAQNIGKYADHLVALFLNRLRDVNYTLRITSELQYFTQLRTLLELRRIQFSPEALEEIIRCIVVPHGQFHPGPPAHLFRKISMSTLRVLLAPDYRVLFKGALSENNGALSAKLAAIWLGGVDADDGEMRLAAIVGLGDIWQIPLMEEGLAADIRDNSILRLDDANEQLRKEAVVQMTRALRSHPETKQPLIGPQLMDAMAEKIVPTVNTMLLHMDDHVEQVGLKEAIATLLIVMGSPPALGGTGFNRNIILKLTQDAKANHTTGRFCEKVIAGLAASEK